MLAIVGCRSAYVVEVPSVSAPPPTEAVTAVSETLLPSTSRADNTPTLSSGLLSTPTPTLTPPPFIGNAGAKPADALLRLGIGYVMAIDVSPDGEEVAVGTSTGVYVYRVEGFEFLWRRYTQEPGRMVAWSADGSRLLTSGGSDGAFSLWDAVEGRKIRELKAWHTLEWSPDGSMIAAELRPPTPNEEETPVGVQIYDGFNGLPLRTLDIQLPQGFYGRTIEEMSWARDGHTLAVVTFGGTLHVWDVSSWTLLHVIDTPDCHEAVFSPDGDKVYITDCWDNLFGGVLVLDTHTVEDSPFPYDDYPGGVAWSPDGTRLAVVGGSDLIMVDGETGEELYRAPYGGHGIDIEWSPDGAVLVLLSDSAATILDGDSGERLLELPLDNDRSWWPLIDWFPDSRKVLYVINGRDISVWDIETGSALQSFSTFEAVGNVAWLPDGKTLVLLVGDEYEFWDVETGTEVHQPLVAVDLSSLFVERWEHSLEPVMSPDASTEVMVDYEGACGDGPWGGGCGRWNARLMIRDAVTGDRIAELGYPHSGVAGLAWSPDGSMLAVGLGASGMLQATDVGAAGVEGSEVILIDVGSGREVLNLSGHSGNVRALAFSPNESMLASASSDGTVIVWDIAR